MGSRPSRVGVSYRPGLASWVDSGPRGVDCLEITVEEFYKSGEARLRALRSRYPLLARSSRLSLGTPGPLDPGALAWVSAVVQGAAPLWVTEHLGFTRTPEMELALPCPIRPGDEALAVLVEHARQVRARCGRPLLIQNITSHFGLPGTMSEPALLNRFCSESGCGLLLDLASLAVSGLSQGFDARAWLGEIEPRHVVAIRLGGYRRADGRWLDGRDGPIPDDVWALANGVLRRGPIRAAVIDRDGPLPHPSLLEAEVNRLRALVGLAPTATALR